MNGSAGPDDTRSSAWAGAAYARVSLTGRVIIVTGAASGIGRATALLVAARGASVVVADTNSLAGEQTAADIRHAGGTAVFTHTDISSEADVMAMVRMAVERFGGLNAAFNNAGILGGHRPAADLTIDQWQRTLDVNLTGTFLCMKHEVAHMIQHGGGVIVNTASGAGVVGVRSAPDYVASKHGVVGLTRALAADYGTQGIRANVLLPGAVSTAMRNDHDAMVGPATPISQTDRPLGRYGTVDEMAEAAAWLLSDSASYATGAAIAIDGGYTCV